MSDSQYGRRSDSGFGDRKRAWRSDGDGDRDGNFKQVKPGSIGIKYLVPGCIVGAVIGKGGEEMKRTKSESGCFVRLSQNDKFFPNTTERPCYLEGTPESIVKALHMMQEKIYTDNPRKGSSIDDNRKKECKLIVSSNAAGKTIGKGGENVKRLKSDYGVWVKCMNREETIPGLEERTITISGELDNVMKAISDILEMALTLSNGGTDKNLDYDRYMEGGDGTDYSSNPPSRYGGGGGGGGYGQGGYNDQQSYQTQGGQGNYYNQSQEQYSKGNTQQASQPRQFQESFQQFPSNDNNSYYNQASTGGTDAGYGNQGGYNNQSAGNQGDASGYQGGYNQGGDQSGYSAGNQGQSDYSYGSGNQGGYDQSGYQAGNQSYQEGANTAGGGGGSGGGGGGGYAGGQGN